jgi:hypothetical protein
MNFRIHAVDRNADMSFPDSHVLRIRARRRLDS